MLMKFVRVVVFILTNQDIFISKCHNCGKTKEVAKVELYGKMINCCEYCLNEWYLK